MKERLNEIYKEITGVLEQELIPFWVSEGIDEIYGGYRLCFNCHGDYIGDDYKMIVTQARQIWAFSALGKHYKKQEYIRLASQGVDFLIKYFWDEEFGGWFWKTDIKGCILDDAKLVYGQTFAIYALSEYTMASGNPIGLEYASRTFELLQINCADTLYGGYYENMSRDWTPNAPGKEAGDVKSLDIHMHMLEALTTLYECSEREVHRRKMLETAELIVQRMVDRQFGCGYNQMGPDFRRRPAILIPKTWAEERAEVSETAEALDTTIYGHNVELAWLLNRALIIAGCDEKRYREITLALVNHSLRYGYDEQHGGVFYSGPYEGPAQGLEKEWWENFEVLTGYLDAYEQTGDICYWDAFAGTWSFINRYMINHAVGESYQLLSADGQILNNTIGNYWKGMYHTGRALLECKKRLLRLAADSRTGRGE